MALKENQTDDVKQARISSSTPRGLLSFSQSWKSIHV